MGKKLGGAILLQDFLMFLGTLFLLCPFTYYPTPLHASERMQEFFFSANKHVVAQMTSAHHNHLEKVT